MIKHVLSERRPGDGILPLGISCDESGVFIAGDVPLIIRSQKAAGLAVYQARAPQTLAALLARAYGAGIDFSAHVVGLSRIAQYMTEGKWVLAKIAAVQLGLPNVSDDLALKKLLAVDAASFSKRCSCRPTKRSHQRMRPAQKRDVSNEPRIPAGQSGGGEWTTGDSPTDLNVIPAQVEVLPMPEEVVPIPFDLPAPPTEVTPFPFDVPGANLDPSNPYPDRPECVEEWAHAIKFCQDLQNRGKLQGGYGGFGKNFTSCVMGMVSEACGGNPTGA